MNIKNRKRGDGEIGCIVVIMLLTFASCVCNDISKTSAELVKTEIQSSERRIIKEQRRQIDDLKLWLEQRDKTPVE